MTSRALPSSTGCVPLAFNTKTRRENQGHEGQPGIGKMILVNSTPAGFEGAGQHPGTWSSLVCSAFTFAEYGEGFYRQPRLRFDSLASFWSTSQGEGEARLIWTCTCH